jgi:hypothetical protein
MRCFTTVHNEQPAAKRRRVVNASLFHKFSKPQHLMFGYHDAAVEVDEYGVREAEPIGWLAMSMQERNDTTDLLEEVRTYNIYIYIYIYHFKFALGP